MLMALLWTVAGPPISYALGFLPDAPEPADWTVPWPAWLPSWPVGLAFVSVLTAGGLFLALRFVRWVYGLIPVVQ